MNGLYGIDGNQQVDNHTLLDIQHPNCTSYQLYKGLLNGASRAIFNGKIYVHANAQKTNAYQLNKHLLLARKLVWIQNHNWKFLPMMSNVRMARQSASCLTKKFLLQSRCIPNKWPYNYCLRDLLTISSVLLRMIPSVVN